MANRARGLGGGIGTDGLVTGRSEFSSPAAAVTAPARSLLDECFPIAVDVSSPAAADRLWASPCLVPRGRREGRTPRRHASGAAAPQGAAPWGRATWIESLDGAGTAAVVISRGSRWRQCRDRVGPHGAPVTDQYLLRQATVVPRAAHRRPAAAIARADRFRRRWSPPVAVEPSARANRRGILGMGPCRVLCSRTDRVKCTRGQTPAVSCFSPPGRAVRRCRSGCLEQAPPGAASRRRRPQTLPHVKPRGSGCSAVRYRPR